MNGSDPKTGRGAAWIVASGVAVVGLALNLGVGWKLGFGRPMESDALYFRDIAQSLAAGKGYVAQESFWPGKPTMQRLPGWPFVVSLALRLAPGASPDAAMRVTAATVHALAAAALALLACALFGRAAVGLLAGALYALHPTGLHAADSGLSEPLFVLAAAAGSLCLLRAASRVWVVAAALVMGLACLVRPNFLLWGAAVAAWMAARWTWRGGFRARRLALALVASVAFALPAVGWMARNARVCGQFPVLSTLRGQTFYGGNNEVVARRGEFWGYWVFPNLIPGETPLVELARTRTEWEVDDYYFRKGAAFLKANGAALPGLAAGKLTRAYWPFPRKPTRAGLAVGAFRALLWAAALAGLALAWRRLPGTHAANLAAMAAANVGTVLIFWGNARFAFEFEAFVVPFAAMGAAGLWDRIRRRGVAEVQDPSGMDFVMIANDWAAGRDNPTSKHRIAVELARRGRRVLWIEGSGMRRPKLGSGADRLRIARKLVAALRPPRPAAGERGIQVLSPLLLPWPGSRMARSWNGWACAAAARFWARRMGLRDPALVNYVPVLGGALAAWRGRRVYHCVDRWDAFGMYDSAVMAAMDEQCCRAADVVVASSHELFERCRRFNPRTYLVMHGVDHEHFAGALASPPRPTDLPPGPVVGFFGLISEWVDQELIVRLARGLRGESGEATANVVLIGTADVPVERLAAESNARLLGPRPFAELPAYVARFAVGIIPFHVNDLTRAVNPIKLREMTAAGCPVVATALPEVARYAGAAGGATAAESAADGVEVAGDAGEFVALVKRRLERPFDAGQRRALSESVRGETWAEKVREILEIVEAA